MFQVVATGMFYGGEDAYFKSGWNIMDGALVVISIIDLLMSLISESSPRIFGILRVRLRNPFFLQNGQYYTDKNNILVLHLLSDWQMRERASNHLPLTVKKYFRRINCGPNLFIVTTYVAYILYSTKVLIAIC